MADLMPDYGVEAQKIRTEISALQHQLERHKLEIMECDSRKDRAKINLEACEKAIVDRRKTLKGLEDTHGKGKTED